MLLGSKPLADFTHDEMLIAIEELRASREALHAEAVKRAARGETVKQPRAAKQPSAEQTAMLAFLKGESEAL